MAGPRHELSAAKSLQTRALALSLMAEHGLSEWAFGFNNNVRRAGVCFHPRGSGPGRIELSVHFVERNDEDDVRDTILHEVAHALVGAWHGHDEVWQAKCVEIGAKPQRCYGPGIDMPKGRWSAACGSCGKTFFRHRRPASLTGWHCKACGKERGQFVWECAEPGG